MHLNPIETSGLGRTRGGLVVLNRTVDLVEGESPGRDGRLWPLGRESLAIEGHSRRRDRQGSAMEVWMRSAAGMPELGEDEAPGVVHGPGDLSPSLDQLGSVDSRRIRPADRLLANLRPL
ncbi:hypothetical protein D3C71_1742420 [compost metagenome]